MAEQVGKGEEVTLMEKVLDIGNGLKIAKVNIEELREQDLNARVMSSDMFNRLAANIKKDNRIESLPFVAETEKGLEIVSGHHRVRACRTAGITEIYIILDDTGLDRDSIRSKQLSHNSLQGEDNKQIVKEIFDLIDDAEKKLEAYINPELNDILDKMSIKDVTFDVDIKNILVTFLSYEKETFERCAQKLNDAYSELYVADINSLKEFSACIKRINKEYDIRAMNTVFTKMAEIVLEHMGEEIEDYERMALRDVFKSAYIPKDSADVILQAIKKAEKDGVISNKNKWQILEYWAADYLAGE